MHAADAGVIMVGRRLTGLRRLHLEGYLHVSENALCALAGAA